jgi:hypothetical protein
MLEFKVEVMVSVASEINSEGLERFDHVFALELS